MITFIIAAMSTDGFIARESTQSSREWRSKGDAKFFIGKTKQAGVVVMGDVTFRTMRRPMPGRLHIVYSHGQIDAEGVEVVTREPKEVLRDLESRGYKEVAICGGATIYTMFMEAGLVDKLYLTIEPIIFGSGVKLFKKDLDVRLKLVAIKKLEDNTVLLEYDVVR